MYSLSSYCTPENLHFICFIHFAIHPPALFPHCSPFAQSEGRSPSTVEEVEENKDVEKEKEADGNSELLFRVQELEVELKDSEQKRMELIHANTALQNKLEPTQEEKGRIHLEMASVKERLLSVLSSQVRKMAVLRHQTDHLEGYVLS